jgi:AraC-like DNA-binding protein
MRLLEGKLVKKILQSKMFFWSTIPILVLGMLVLTYFVSIQDFPVFPNNQNFEYKFYSDNSSDSNTKIIRQLVTDSMIQLDYQMNNKTKDPYAGVNIGPKGSKSINLGRYNQLTIKLKGEELNGIGITLITQNFLKEYKDKSLEILFYHIFKIVPGVNTYRINTNKFQIPDWWGENNRIEDASSIEPNLKSLETINVSGAFTNNDGKMQSIEIYSMAFSRNNKPLISAIIAFELLYILFAFFAIYVTEKMREKKQTITINYKAVENKTVETLKSDFIDFINTNFQNSQLTLELVSTETGVSQRRITNEVQNQFGCNFKTYINRLRINESKRLLSKKELNIGEIAFRVGFNNQSHFNRVFKSELQISPTEYRDKHKT